MRRKLLEMRDFTENLMKDWFILALAGIGISFPPHHYIGGLLLAMAGAAIASRAQPEQNRQELWTVLMTAWVIATVSAVVLYNMRPDFPPQVVMAAAGFFSRFVARFLLALAGKLELRTDTIFDRLLDKVLPPRSDK